MREFEILYDRIVNPVVPENITPEWIYAEVKARLMLESEWKEDRDNKIVKQLSEAFFVNENGIVEENLLGRLGGHGIEIIIDIIGGIIGVLDPTGIVSLIHSVTYWWRGQYFMGLITLLGAIPALGSAASLVGTALRTKTPVLSALNQLRMTHRAASQGTRLLGRNSYFTRGGREARRATTRSNRAVLKARRERLAQAGRKVDTSPPRIPQAAPQIPPKEAGLLRRFFISVGNRVPRINDRLNTAAQALRDRGGFFGPVFKRIANAIQNMSGYLRRVSSFILGTRRTGGAVRHGVGTVLNPSDYRWKDEQRVANMIFGDREETSSKEEPSRGSSRESSRVSSSRTNNRPRKREDDVYADLYSW